MTKAQMAERIAELEKEVEALKAGASVETHIHYHYPQILPQQNYTWIDPNSPFTVWAEADSGGIGWTQPS